MFEKTLDQMQTLGKQWAETGRKMTREALQATSTSLESAARYLEHLGSRLDQEPGESGAVHTAPPSEPASESTGPSASAGEGERGEEHAAASRSMN